MEITELRRHWMMCVDGENFCLRGQEFASARGIALLEGPYYRKDVFLWLRNTRGTIFGPQGYPQQAIPSYYYTSLIGDERKLLEVREALWALGFHPEVFKRFQGQQKAKGVDITLARDFLTHAFHNDYGAAILVAGDGDYIPLVDTVKRFGKIVDLMFFSEKGLNRELRLACDSFYPIDEPFLHTWASG